jgi:hypothetical protein
MTWGQVVYGFVALLLNGTVVLAIIKLYVDRKTNRARGVVETATVGSQINAAELANEVTQFSILEKRLNYIDKAHAAERRSWHESLTELRRRVDDLEQERTRNRQRFHVAVDYIRVLRLMLQEQTTIPVPAIPAGLDIDE